MHLTCSLAFSFPPSLLTSELVVCLGPSDKDTERWIVEVLESEGFGGRKPAVNEKLLRVIHILAFFVGLFTRDGQKVFWMTDNDAISETEEMHMNTLSLLQRVLTLYTKDGVEFPVLGGALPFADDQLGTRDMLSATDVVAGSLSQYLTQRARVPPQEIRVKDGCDRVLQWLGHDGIGLKKMNVVMREGKHGLVESVTVEFQESATTDRRDSHPGVRLKLAVNAQVLRHSDHESVR